MLEEVGRSYGAIEKMEDIFLKIVRLGIGHSQGDLFSEVNWESIEELAFIQGLSAIIVDGIEKLPASQRPPIDVLLQWIGEVLQGYEYRYELYCRAIAELASFYNGHGYKMMVLKGYSCSINWPKPEHRPCGDIDIWLFGKQNETDVLLAKEKGIKIDKSHHHHTVFYWHDFMVENHYDFINVHHHKSSAKIETILKQLGSDDSHFTEVYGKKVYLPSPNLHALFLIRHLVSHFASEAITLRQVLDWAFFVEKHGHEVDWMWLLEILNEHHMMEFFNCINAISVENLGFDSKIFPYVQLLPCLKERILNDTFSQTFSHEEPNSIFLRIPFKYKRWKANQWKHELCYKESMRSAFWSGIWNHILKPSSI